jgi:hypothetical protein
MAVIANARVAAAHEGTAELVVTIRYSNGGTSEIALDAIATEQLMQSCEATTLDGLHGQSWKKVQAALSASYNRYNQ